MNITEPLRVAVGSHQAGSGKGCAMNVVSWMNGDTTITDTPACSDPVLARIVQRTNDNMCSHRDGDLLCAPCSIEAIKLGVRTIGTGDLPLTDLERREVWMRVAYAYATSTTNAAARLRVAHLAIDTFNELTGRTETAPTDEAVTTAYRQMVTA